MALWKPDPSFYPSARLAGQAPAERLDYVVTFDPQTVLGRSANGKPDSLAVIDVDPMSSACGKIVGRLELGRGNELHQLRVERMQCRALSQLAPSTCRAPLPGYPRLALLAHLYRRYQARPAPSDAGADD